MAELLDDTWNPRDFPVLREAARLIELADPSVGARYVDIAAALDLDIWEVVRSARILRDAGLVELRETMPAHGGRVVRISAGARQLVGQWPTEENALDRLIAALEALGESAELSAEDRKKAKSTGAWLKATATTVGTGVITAVLTGQLPH